MAKQSEKIGIVYHADYLIHTQRSHPEKKERLEYIMAAIENEQLMDRLEMVEPFPANVSDINLVHNLDYIKSIEKACLDRRPFLDMDTYIVPESYRVALLSTGGALAGLRSIFNNQMRRVFVFNRPPGHHAEYDQAMGFCIFNNVAIAASVARRDYAVKRIAIVDWDVHHGNGTQQAFEEDSSVLFISIHQSPAYPGTGYLNQVGVKEGTGFTVNVPLPAGCGDVEYRLFFEQLITPILDQYKPELLIVSAGQDAYRRDPLAGMSLTHQGYFDMACSLADVSERCSNGRILLCLEGGYHLEGQAGSVLQVLNALGNWGLPPTEQSPELEPTITVQKRLQEVLSVQRAHWNI